MAGFARYNEKAVESSKEINLAANSFFLLSSFFAKGNILRGGRRQKIYSLCICASHTVIFS